jgi:hypothetical protein
MVNNHDVVIIIGRIEPEKRTELYFNIYSGRSPKVSESKSHTPPSGTCRIAVP